MRLRSLILKMLLLGLKEKILNGHDVCKVDFMTQSNFYIHLSIKPYS